MLNLLAILLIFGLPILVVPNPVGYFEVPKVITAEVLVGILAFFVVINGFSFKKLSPIGLAVLALIFLASLINFLFSISSEAFWGNIYRLQGVFLLWILLIWALIAHKFPYKNPWSIYAFVTLVGLAASCFVFGANHASRLIGSLGEPNALAATAVFMTALTFGSKNKILVVFSVFLSLGIIFVSGSRSGLIGLGIIFLFFVLTLLKMLVTWQRFTIGLILILICNGLPFFQPKLGFEDRSEIWQTSLAAGSETPILGHGFGNTFQVLHQTSEKLQNNIRFQNVDSAHNLWLEFWVSGGIISLISLLVLVWLSIRKQIHDDNHRFSSSNLPLLSAWLGLLVMFSFNPMSVVNLIELWWLIGLGLEYER